MIERLAIVGVGLLGGSAALAVRKLGLAREIVGVGRDAARLAPALDAGVLDRATTDVGAGVAEADFVLLAATVAANEDLLGAVWKATAPGTIVTDVGSTKRGIVRVAEALARSRPLTFVGSHPMAGSAVRVHSLHLRMVHLRIIHRRMVHVRMVHLRMVHRLFWCRAFRRPHLHAGHIHRLRKRGRRADCTAERARDEQNSLFHADSPGEAPPTGQRFPTFSSDD